MNSAGTQTIPVTIIGLGAMGSAIARTLAQAGHTVTVWNRTLRSLPEYGLDGAQVTQASSPADAVAAALVAVICVRDHRASRDLIDQFGAHSSGDVVVVNVSTGSPAEAIESSRRAEELGMRYVTGAVMVPTSMVGTEHFSLLCAGNSRDVAAVREALAALGGAIEAVGSDHAVPPALDLAMLDIYFAGMYAFLHAAAVAEVHGIGPARFLPYAERIVGTLRGTLPGLTDAITRRSYYDGEARLDMCLAFLEHIVATSADVGIDPGLARQVRDASAAAMRHWPPSTDWDVVAERFLERERRS